MAKKKPIVERKYIILNKRTNKYYQFFECGSNCVCWTEFKEDGHRFRSVECAQYVIDTFKLTDVEIII